MLRNGTQLLAEEIEPAEASSGGPVRRAGATEAALRAGDFVQVVVRQNSGINQTVFKDDPLTPELSTTWLAPAP